VHGKGNDLVRNSSANAHSHRAGEGIFSAISFGAFFILVGTVFVAALPTNLWDKIVDFFKSFTTQQVTDTAIYLPVPTSPGAHAVIYTAAFQFCLGIAVMQIVLLILRLLWHSPISKTAETAGHLVYWFGASYLVFTFLNSSTTTTTWFAFWAAILVALGVSLIVRATVLFAKKHF
jgi:hypothetical protein